MSRPSKFPEIASLIEQRIQRGDYLLSGLQSDRTIAEEFNISRLTARHAIRLLVDRGFIIRKTNGRLELPGRESADASVRQVAFLAPSFPSPFIQRLRLAAEQIVTARGSRFRPIDYLHWSDPVVHETMQRFDGAIMVPPAGGDLLPEQVERMRNARAGMLLVGWDLSGQGVPSLMINPPEGTQTLCDHLATLGHKRIDCLSVHAPSNGINLRMQQWRLWRAAHGVDGTLHDHRLQSYANPMQGGYDVTKALLAAGTLGQALVCTSELTTIGACRAMAEVGLLPGRDISIATWGGDGLCRFYSPSISCLEMPDLAPYLRVWFDWIDGGRKGWVGPLLLRPDDSLFAGESTAPPGGWPAGERHLAGPVPSAALPPIVNAR